jgi:hypothetical protein
MEQRRHLDRNLIEYAFSEVYLTNTDAKGRKSVLKKALHASGKSILGRKLRQVVSRFDDHRKREIHLYLKGKQGNDAVYLSEALLLTLPEFQETLANYCASGYRKELKTIEIAKDIREPGLPFMENPTLPEHAQALSVKISQARTKAKDGRLFKLEDGQELYLRFRKNEVNKKEYFYWLVIETKKELDLEKTLGVVICAPQHIKTEKLLDDPAMTSIWSDIEMWKPTVSRALSGSLNVVDVFMVKAAGSTHTRFFIEEGRLFTIYDKKALAVEEVMPIVAEE